MASMGQELIDAICDIAGEDTVTTLLERYGGSRVSLSARVGPECWLSLLVGQDAAQQVVERLFICKSELVEVPLAERGATERNRREIWRRLKLGQTVDRIAREVGVSRRTVQRHRQRLKQIARRTAGPRVKEPSSC